MEKFFPHGQIQKKKWKNNTVIKKIQALKKFAKNGGEGLEFRQKFVLKFLKEWKSTSKKSLKNEGACFLFIMVQEQKQSKIFCAKHSNLVKWDVFIIEEIASEGIGQIVTDLQMKRKNIKKSWKILQANLQQEKYKTFLYK